MSGYKQLEIIYWSTFFSGPPNVELKGHKCFVVIENKISD